MTTTYLPANANPFAFADKDLLDAILQRHQQLAADAQRVSPLARMEERWRAERLALGIVDEN